MTYLVLSIHVALVWMSALGLQPQASRDRAQTLLHRAADALGGEATLRSLKSIETSGVSVWHQREQSERPEGPWVLTFYDFTDVRNFDADAVRLYEPGSRIFGSRLGRQQGLGPGIDDAHRQRRGVSSRNR